MQQGESTGVEAWNLNSSLGLNFVAKNNNSQGVFFTKKLFSFIIKSMFSSKVI